MSRISSRSAAGSRRRRGLSWHRVSFALARLGVIAIGIGLALLLISKLSHPYVLHWSENKSVAEDRKLRDYLKSDNGRLNRRKTYLNTPAGEIAQSRSLGYHFPDENPVRVQEQQPKPAAPSQTQ